MADQLQIALFGGMQISMDGKPVSGFVSAKVQALLAYLAVTGRPLSRDALAALLWGEMSESDAKTNLRQALANLRKLVPLHVTIDRESVGFERSSPYSLDTELFEQDGASLPTDADSILNLENAVALYRGDFLAGFHVRDAPEFETWALSRGEHFRSAALEILDTLAEHYASTSAYPQAIACLRRSLALEPWREESHRRLMLMLARASQRSAALAQFDLCRNLLEKELNVSPSAETTALYEKIRVAQTMRRHNLTPLSTPFVGRANELTLISKRLSDPTCRLLTLTGVGGMGKTRLAMQTAERWAEIMLHGVRFVPLASVPANDRDLLIMAIADAFHLYSSQSNALQQLTNYLRDKELLLVLDNFEHLVEVAPVLTEILDQAPDLKMLVTSRLRLNLYGEHVFEVEEMSFPVEEEKKGDASELAAKYDAVNFFAESAARVRTNFSLRQNTAPVTRICRLVRGMPLGIELAAVWVGEMDAPAIADEIEKGLDFLSATQRGVPDRQRSLRVVFEHSWTMLTETEQRVFASLSVFRGGFGKEQAKAVADADAKTLSALVGKSFLRQNADGRYEMHHVLQAYGEEKLPLAESAARSARERHAEVYGKFLRGCESALKSGGLKVALDEINREIENVHLGWNWAIEQKRADVLNDYIEGLYQFYIVRSWLKEGAKAFGRAHRMLEEGDEKIILARTMAREAKFHAALSRTSQAMEMLLSSLSVLRSTGGREEVAAALTHLGVCARQSGDFEKARTYLQESISLGEEAGNIWLKANALLSLAGVAFRSGDSVEGRKLCEQGLECFRRTGDPSGIADCLVGLGIITQAAGEYEASRRYCEESLAIYRELGEPVNIALALYNLGRLDITLKSYAEATRNCEQSLDIRRELGEITGQVGCLSLLGDIAAAQKKNADAMKRYDEALHLAKSVRMDVFFLELLAKKTNIIGRNPSLTKSQRERLLAILHFILSQSECDESMRPQLEKLQASLSVPFSAEKIRTAKSAGESMTLEEAMAALEEF